MSDLITNYFVQRVREKVVRERIYLIAAVAAGFSLDALFRMPALEALALRLQTDRARVEGKTAVVHLSGSTPTI